MPGHKYSERNALRDPETGEWDRKELRHRIKGWLAVLLAFGVLAAGILFVGQKALNFWADFQTAEDYAAGPGTKEVTVTIAKGASVTAIGQTLQDADVVKDARTFQRRAQMRPDDFKRVQAGKYRMMTRISADQAIDMLLDPTRAVRVLMQLAEGQRLFPQQVDAIAKSTKLPAKSITEVLKKSSAKQLGLPGWAKPKDPATKAEGFLFPDTYEIGDKPTALGSVKLATAQFNKVAEQLDFEALSGETPVKDPYQVLIVASIIEREVFRDEDRAKVARVIYNRIAAKQKLELDSTVAYAVGKTNTIWTTDADRQSSSPYNTYRHTGLPPGPIAAPARKALEAAANPEPGDWLYFMPVNLDTGETRFTSDYNEHLRNKKALDDWCNATPENLKKCQ